MPLVGHCAVKDLPSTVQNALRSIGYAKKDIGVNAEEKTSVGDCGCDGRRSFVMLLDLASGESKTMRGSWGGANIFNPRNQVDLDFEDYALPPGGAVIHASEGYGGVWASLTIHPSNVAKLLPASGSDVSEKDRKILAAIGGLKSGPYRKEALDRLGTTPADLDSLVSRGFLSRNKAGAIAITTAGKNARGNERCY